MSDANNSQYESHLLSFCHLLARHARPNLTITRRLRESEAQPCTPVSHQHTNIFCSYHIISFPFHWTHWSGINPCLTTIYPCLYLSLLDTISHTRTRARTHTQSSHPPTGAMSELDRRVLISRPIIVKFKFLTTKSFSLWQQLKLNGLVMARMYHCYRSNKYPPFYPPLILDGLGVGRR